MPDVVTVLLIHNNELLILKRSEKVRTYKGLWGGVAGYVEKNEKPYDTAIKEIREEAGLEKEDIEFVKRGKTVRYTDVYEGEKYDWVIHTFVFKIEKKDKVQIDWEHSQYAWILPQNIVDYETVPQLKEIVLETLV